MDHTNLNFKNLPKYQDRKIIDNLSIIYQYFINYYRYNNRNKNLCDPSLRPIINYKLIGDFERNFTQS